ncbi:MAG: tRNA (guanosine(46)-N7)-methyltransferase TrmB [Saprospiraceae bacterium]|nr:tRNA (guanosine(46)-N7)-methyltransferase TrmB [Saprospiraceae bacterium]
MSKRNKLQKFADILSYPNVLENFDAKNPHLVGKDGVVVERKGAWAKKQFGNQQPITLELACGKGDYTIGLAKMYPDRNFIGVDIKGARIWKGATLALEEKLENVAFFRTRIEQIAYFFEPGEVAEIWITFPDPFLRKSKSNRRLTAVNFLRHYSKILKSDGIVHLKTDSPELYDFTLATLEETDLATLLYNKDDIYSDDLYLPELELKTFYEQMHLENGLTIKYIQMRLEKTLDGSISESE